MAELHCLVVTPEETAVDEKVTFVALPLFDGEKGVSAGHAPLIGRMGAGELRMTTVDGKTLRYFIEGGFVQIADNVVSIMSNRAIPASSLSVEEAEELVKSASSEKANSEELLEAREKAVHQARAQLRVAKK